MQARIRLPFYARWSAMSSSPRKSLSERLDSLLPVPDEPLTNTPEAPRPAVPRTLKTQGPVLRWLGSWSPNSPKSRSAPETPSNSNPPSPPPSPGILSLNEALHEPIQRLPKPRLPDSFHPHTHPPPFLDNLTRSTLPISSLSPAISVRNGRAPREAYTNNPLHSPPIFLNSSQSKRSSLDTLRSVSSRDHKQTLSVESTSSVEPVTSPFNWNWFQPGGKEDVDPLLDEEDRAETVADEQQRFKKKCTHFQDPFTCCEANNDH